MSENEEIIVHEEVVEESTEKSVSSFTTNISNFFSENKSNLIKWAAIPLAIIALVVVWRVWWLPQRNAEANTKLAKLHHFYKLDSMDVVLKGKSKVTSAPEIARSYWLTAKGKEAALMAATAYLKQGKYQEAIDFFDKCKSRDNTLRASILAGKASCYSELKEYKKAGSLYLQAAKIGDNEFTAMFYKKAGIHFEMSKEYGKAVKAYTALKTKYAGTGIQEISDIDRYIYKAKALNGDLEKN
jgi:tetratricopeptide (TPR) repeat protein